MAQTKIDFVPPGPGPWEFDYSHFARPLPRYAADIYCRGFTEGQAMGFERAGFPGRTIAMKMVSGFPYVQFQPLLGSPADTKLPPKWLFKIVGMLHPALRKRYRAARAYVESRLWREDVREWDEVLKPKLVAALEKLSAVDPTELDDEALVSHLGDCQQAILEDMHIHFFVNPATILPVGQFLRQAQGWTGATSAELLALVSAGTETGDPRLVALVEAIRSQDQTALVAPNGKSADQVLAALKAAGGPVGEATRAWLAAMSVRQLAAGDLSSPNGDEVPELLVANLRQALAQQQRPARASGDLEAIRTRVPASERAEFDQLLEEARFVYRLRDERCSMLDVWCLGVCRRALMAAGSRLVERGILAEPGHVVDLDHDELAALLHGGSGPSAAEVAERTRVRESTASSEAPLFLGGEPPGPPPFEFFPPVVAEVLRSVFHYVDEMNGTMEPASSGAEPAVLRGRPASRGTARGTARVVNEPADFAKVRQGDILVARSTMPSYNGLLPLLSGIVTDFGGTLCHAAIVAREYGIPAVVNTQVATEIISDGDTLEIDGDSGTVQICR